MPRERDLSRILAAREGSECEVKTPVGYIDVLTPKVLYEVKEVGGWKGALGQVLAYGHYYPNHKLKLYLYGEASTKQKLLIKEHCTERGVSLAWHREPKLDEPSPPPKAAAPLADGLKLMLFARDVRYGVKAGCNVNILTPTAPFARETLDAYLDEALTVFDALLDNELTLTLHYTFGNEQIKLTRIRAGVLGEPVMYRLHLSIMTSRAIPFSTSLPGTRSNLPSGQHLNKQTNYGLLPHIPEINQLRNLIIHPQFRWALQYNYPATAIVKAHWLLSKR